MLMISSICPVGSLLFKLVLNIVFSWYNEYCPPFILPSLSVSFLSLSLIMLSVKVPCELARYAGAAAPASCQGIPLKPLYIRKLAGFFKCLFYFRLKIQYIFYIYGWFSQLYFCQYPALPEKNNWLSGMLFLFLAEKTAVFFISGWLFQTTFCTWKNRFLLMTDI